jgi:cytochrome oxidase Cu insertion factor (SCO1/SenC/PrrC family)
MALSKRRKLSLLIAGLVVIAGGLAGAVFVVPHLDDGGPALTSAEVSAAPAAGAPAPAFTAVDTRGATHSLEAYRGRWVVLEWFNHDCPYTKKHYKALDGGLGNTQAMQRDYANRVVWLSIVSSAPGRQGFTTDEKADELTREKGAAPTAVIRDTTGALGRLYGARNTPQYAIIDPQGVLRYTGAIDSNPSARAKDIAGATNYVRAALDAGLAGTPIAVAQTQPYGCDVKY